MTQIAETRNGSIIIEADSAAPIGDWKKVEIGGATGMLFDPEQSYLNGPVEAQTLTYRFRTAEAATYRIAIKSGRIMSAIGRRAPGGDSRGIGDTRNNDVYISIINDATNEVVLNPTRLFTGLHKDSDGELWWGNQFDISNGGPENWLIEPDYEKARSKVKLEANTVYRLELSGRSDGYVVNRITLRSDSHLRNTTAHRAPAGEAPPELPTPSINDVDLSQYPDMEVWSKAGVEGGIPTDLPVLKTINPGDDIQEAIGDVSRAGGGVLRLKSGTYSVTDEISIESKVVVRGEDPKTTRIEFRYEGEQGRELFVFNSGTQYAGIEDMWLEYMTSGAVKPRSGVYETVQPTFNACLVHLRRGSRNNWVKGVTALNAGVDPIRVEGSHHTLTGNHVEGAHNKSGGRGYYRIRGSHNLIQGEVVKDLRHFGILNTESNYNVVVGCHFETDINFHLGDTGHNLIEGNTIKPPSYHLWWPAFSTGGPAWGHLPPGNDNLIVNNLVLQENRETLPASRSFADSPWSQENVVYTFEGYGSPVPTDISVPQGGRFYVPAWSNGVLK